MMGDLAQDEFARRLVAVAENTESLLDKLLQPHILPGEKTRPRACWKPCATPRWGVASVCGLSCWSRRLGCSGGRTKVFFARLVRLR